jgi:hypothetical protein
MQSKCVSDKQAQSNGKHAFCGLFLSMNEAFVNCKVDFDDNGKPVDFVFSDVNEACKRLFKLKYKPVAGRKITKVFPDSKKSPIR